MSWILQRFRHRHRRHGKGVSIVIPFLTDNAERARNLDWLVRYWTAKLPKAQLIICTDCHKPFRKTNAVNSGFRLATGDVIAIIDADAFLDHRAVLEAARRIREDRREWFIPYRRMYRLTRYVTELVVSSDPSDPLILGDPPVSHAWIDEGGQSVGHHYGALASIMPREAFEAVRGMDPRFEGWGGEDISFMRSIDTLYHRHKTLDEPAYHLWHPTKAGVWKGTKQWEDQPRATMNTALTVRYNRAFNDPEAMRKLVDER